MLSDYKLSEKRQALKEHIEKEKENADNELNAFLVHNPQKVLQSFINNIIQSMYQFNNGEVTLGGGVKFGKGGILDFKHSKSRFKGINHNSG
jgi:hypothetical protein